MAWLATAAGFILHRAGSASLWVKLGALALSLGASAWGGWWWKSTLAQAAEAEHLAAVVNWYEEQNKLSKARYEQHLRTVQTSMDYYRGRAAKASQVATPECTDLGAEWRGVFNDLSRKANAAAAH